MAYNDKQRKQRKPSSKDDKSKFRKNGKERSGDTARAGRRTEFAENNTAATHQSAANDVNWYVARPNMLTDVARVPMNVATGVPMTFKGRDGAADTSYTIPGIIEAKWYPTVGLSTDSSSPVNVVARSLFSFIRHVNSGTINYEQSDVVMYLMAIDSIYTVFQSCVRMYGLSLLSNPYNRYWMDELAKSAGADPDDLRANRDVYLGRLNGLAAKISNLFCPNTFPIISRHIWLSSGVYADRPSARAQLYLFRVGGYYKYDPKHDNGGALTMNEITATTLGEWLDVLEDMLGAVITDSDFAKISGDVLAAYGVQNMMRIATVDRDYVVAPSFQPEVLTQIQNMMWAAKEDELKWSTSEGETAAIWQKDNIVYSEPHFSTNKSCPRECALLMPMDDPTPADVMVATRDMFYLEKKAEKQYLIHCGSEIFTTLTIVYTLNGRLVNRFMVDKNYTSQTFGNATPLFSVLNNFSMHPAVFAEFGSSLGGPEFGIIAEVNNVVPLPDATLNGMHTNALLSEFNIATIGLV